MNRKDMTEALAEQKKQFAGGIPECGADALRMALCSYSFKGSVIHYDFVKRQYVHVYLFGTNIINKNIGSQNI